MRYTRKSFILEQNFVTMLYKVLLTNSEKKVMMDSEVYEKLKTFVYFENFEILKKLRLHSKGYVFFQKGKKESNGKFQVETIYLHKFIANFFMPESKPENTDDYKVVFLNGNKLDCRIHNLQWVKTADTARFRGHRGNKTGFRGVYQDGKKFRAVLYDKSKRYNLGLYPSPEEAARAYNEKSLELFGETRSLNKL